MTMSVVDNYRVIMALYSFNDTLPTLEYDFVCIYVKITSASRQLRTKNMKIVEDLESQHQLKNESI